MSDLSNLLAPGFFFGNNPNTPQALRQKIALAMLMQKRKAPSNLGEGLSAIGDSLGDIGMMRRIEGEAAAAEQAGQAARTSYDTRDGAASPQSASPPPVQAAAVSAPSPLYSPNPAPTDQTPVPGDVQEGGPPRTLPQFRQASRTMPTTPPAPAPGSLPPTGVPGNTGATTFPPPFQPPPTPLPDDQQQTYEPGAATRMPAQPGRPTVADFGQKLALAPTAPATPPTGAPSFDAPIGQYDPQSDPRRAIGMALMRQQLGGQPPPVSRGAATPPPPAPMPPTPQADASQGIRPAPSAAPPIVKVPPAGYVTPPQAEPAPPQVQTDNMKRLQNMIENAPPAQRDSVAAALAPRIAIEQAKLAQEQKVYQDKLTQAHELRMERERQSSTAAGRVTENALQNEAITKAAAENKLRAQFGNLPPEDVIKTTLASKTIAKSGADALQASAAAREAIRGGAITGIGAEAKLNVAKLFTAMGLPDKGNVVANTEVFKSAMQPVVAAILHQTSGTSQLSEGELAFAKAAAAGNISLEPKSIERLMDIIDKRSREVIKDHQTLTDAMFGRDNPQSKAMFGVEMPRTRDDDALDWASKNPNDPRAAAIRQRLGR